MVLFPFFLFLIKCVTNTILFGIFEYDFFSMHNYFSKLKVRITHYSYLCWCVDLEDILILIWSLHCCFKICVKLVSIIIMQAENRKPILNWHITHINTVQAAVYVFNGYTYNAVDAHLCSQVNILKNHFIKLPVKLHLLFGIS